MIRDLASAGLITPSILEYLEASWQSGENSKWRTTELRVQLAASPNLMHKMGLLPLILWLSNCQLHLRWASHRGGWGALNGTS